MALPDRGFVTVMQYEHHERRHRLPPWDMSNGRQLADQQPDDPV
jgi:hypothetical protein